MRMVVLDGAERADAMEGWIGALEDAAHARGHSLRRFRLRALRISQCRGCFECWVKTPGRCRIRDDAEGVVRAYLAADVAVIASPLAMGFTTALTRRMQERLLPVLHPYFEVVEGEIHHRARYARAPKLALVHDGADIDAEDEALLVALYRRTALNMRTVLAHHATTRQSPEEFCDAIARV